jgi:phosphoribosylglycinamide formyltransferase-1
VHYVCAEVDGGAIIAQFSVPVMLDDTPEILAQRVQQAEKNLLPQVIGDLYLRL